MGRATGSRVLNFKDTYLYKEVLVPKQELLELEEKIKKAIKDRNKEDYKSLIKVYNSKKNSLRETLEKGIPIETRELYRKLVNGTKGTVNGKSRT